MAKPIMIQGTMSNAGKSLIAAGLAYSGRTATVWLPLNPRIWLSILLSQRRV